MATVTPITPGECAVKIDRANTIAVLSGAGLSTAAGVPDFRGPNGLYVTRAYDPDTVFEINYFVEDPQPFYQFSRDFLTLLDRLQPTYTHRFLAALEASGKNIGVITQNIDGLHQLAGSKRVYPLHGDYNTYHCIRCGKMGTGAELRALMGISDVPHCPKCKGLVKPDVVFFGESVRHLEAASLLAGKCDLMLVLGSSLRVYPASALPSHAPGEVVAVNRGEISLPVGKEVFLADADLDTFFREVAENLPQVGDRLR